MPGKTGTDPDGATFVYDVNVEKIYTSMPTVLTAAMKGQMNGGEWVAKTNSSGNVEAIWTTIPDTLTDGMKGELYDGEWEAESGAICWTKVPTMKLEGMYCKDSDGVHFIYLRNSENALTKYYIETPAVLTASMVGLTDGGEWKVNASGDQIWVEEPATLTAGMKGEAGDGTWEVNSEGEKIWTTMPTTMIEGLVGEKDGGKWNAIVSWTDEPTPLVAGIYGTDSDGSAWITEENDGTVEKIYTSMPTALKAGMKGKSDGGRWYVDENDELVWTETPRYLDDIVIEKDGGEYILVPYWTTDPSTLVTNMRGFAENGGEWTVNENNDKIYVVEPTELKPGMKGVADSGEWEISTDGSKVWSKAPSVLEKNETGNTDGGTWKAAKIWVVEPTTLVAGMRGEEDGGSWYINSTGEKIWVVEPDTLLPGMKGEENGGTWEVNSDNEKVWTSPTEALSEEVGETDGGEWYGKQIWTAEPLTLKEGMLGSDSNGEWTVVVNSDDTLEKVYTTLPTTLIPGMKGTYNGGKWEVVDNDGTLERIWTTDSTPLMPGEKGITNGAHYTVDINAEKVFSEIPNPGIPRAYCNTPDGEFVFDNDGITHLYVDFPPILQEGMQGVKWGAKWIVRNTAAEDELVSLEIYFLEVPDSRYMSEFINGMKGGSDGGEWYYNLSKQSIWWTISPNVIAEGMRGADGDNTHFEWRADHDGDGNWCKCYIDYSTYTAADITSLGGSIYGYFEAYHSHYRAVCEDGVTVVCTWTDRVYAISPVLLAEGLLGENSGATYTTKNVNGKVQIVWTSFPDPLEVGMIGETNNGSWYINDDGVRVWTTEPSDMYTNPIYEGDIVETSDGGIYQMRLI